MQLVSPTLLLGTKCTSTARHLLSISIMKVMPVVIVVSLCLKDQEVQISTSYIILQMVLGLLQVVLGARKRSGATPTAAEGATLGYFPFFFPLAI